MQVWLEWLENTSIALSIRQSLWLYPTLEIVHILGIVLLVGAAFMFDLRLLGFSKELSVGGLSRHLLPWSQKGLYLIFPSGILLFMTNAKSLAINPIFWLKMGLLVIAGINVLIFHRFIFNKIIRLEKSHLLPNDAKIAAGISILVWIAIIACGRWLAY